MENKQYPVDPGRFVELPNGKCMFSKDSPPWGRTWKCPVCGCRNMAGDDQSMMRFGMCERDSLWWEENQSDSSSTFEEKKTKFLNWLVNRSEKLIYNKE